MLGEGQSGMTDCARTDEGARAEAVAAAGVLRSTETVHRFALEVGAIGAWDLDLVGGGSWRALRHDQIFGYPDGLAEWTYNDFLAHVHPEDTAIVDERFGIGGGEQWRLGLRLPHPPRERRGRALDRRPSSKLPLRLVD